jgi:hypothetical protein
MTEDKNACSYASISPYFMEWCLMKGRTVGGKKDMYLTVLELLQGEQLGL